jgi:hypothetical protein
MGMTINSGYMFASDKGKLSRNWMQQIP